VPNRANPVVNFVPRLQPANIIAQRQVFTLMDVAYRDKSDHLANLHWASRNYECPVGWNVVLLLNYSKATGFRAVWNLCRPSTRYLSIQLPISLDPGRPTSPFEIRGGDYELASRSQNILTMNK